MSDTTTENIPSPGAAAGEENFADLLEKSFGVSERLRPGQKVKGRIVSVSGDVVYIDLGGKSEGTIDISEFTDKDGVVSVHEGDEIDAFFVSVRDGVRRLTTLIHGYSAVTLKAIKDAVDAGLPISGEVKREVKGGFEVSVGGVRCFCPFSHIDLRGGREGGIYLGRTFSFKVLEYGENGRNVLLSRRLVLEEEKQAKVKALKESLSVGMDVTGTIRAVQDFGAFIDLGGIDGLIPASEVSWDRGVRPKNVLAPGQEVTARILSLDWENNRLSLSIKSTQSDPWAGVEDRYAVDSKVSGTIVRLAPFGAFVSLEPAVDGLIHISNLGAGRRINHPREVVEEGQWVEAYVLAVDPQNRKISLSLQPKPKPEKIALPSVGQIFDSVVEKVMPFGIFVKMGNGLSGLVPNSEMGTPQGTDHRRMFPAGSPMEVVVIDVDSASGKIRLSRKALLEKETEKEFKEYEEYTAPARQQTGGLGSLGEILKAKMEEKQAG